MNLQRNTAKIGCATRDTPPCFLYVWQRKGLRDGEFVCVAGKGLRVHFADVWQAKELGSVGRSESLTMELWELTRKFGRGIGGAFGERVTRDDHA